MKKFFEELEWIFANHKVDDAARKDIRGFIQRNIPGFRCGAVITAQEKAKRDARPSPSYDPHAAYRAHCQDEIFRLMASEGCVLETVRPSLRDPGGEEYEYTVWALIPDKNDRKPDET